MFPRKKMMKKGGADISFKKNFRFIESKNPDRFRSVVANAGKGRKFLV